MELIPISNLLFMLIPLMAVGCILYAWCGKRYEVIWATIRMTTQLIIIGFVLVYIFKTADLWIGYLLMAVMMLVSSWIAIRPIQENRGRTFILAFFSIALCGSLMLLLICKGVLELDPWYQARITIPLAGMAYSCCMNVVSLAAERYEKERKLGVSYQAARNSAYNACLIPQINMFFAVGLVSLPGMMTGQILGGVSPLIAVRYQIMVMSMLLGAGGLSAALFLTMKGLKAGEK